VGQRINIKIFAPLGKVQVLSVVIFLSLWRRSCE